MYGKLFNVFHHTATRKVALGGVGIIGASSGNILSQSEMGFHQPVARTVYAAQILDENEDMTVAREVEVKSSSGKNSSDSLFDAQFVCEVVQREPVQDYEADSAVEAIFSSPSTVESVISTGMRPGQARGSLDLDAVMREVRSIVTNQKLIQSTCQKIEQRKAYEAERNTKERDAAVQSIEEAPVQKKAATVSVAVSPNTVSLSEASWEDLTNEFPCAICLDVCSAPHLLDCQHTFCWDCLDGLKSSCVSQDAAVEVMHSCPECRHDFSTAVFEMRYDDCIRKRVDEFPDCAQKQNWREKREKYEQRDREAENSPINKDDTSSERYEEDDNEDWDQFVQDYVVPVMAIAVLLLVISCRRA